MAYTNNNARVILMMGAPGCGKGTQSARLTSLLGIPSLSTGEILRAAAKADTPEGEKLRGILASGSLVDDATVCATIAARLRQELRRGGLILDGFPRTVEQARFLDSVLASMDAPGPTVLMMEVSTGTLLERLTARRQCANCGKIYNLRSNRSAKGNFCEVDGGLLEERADDTEEIILRRFAEYEDRTAPVVAYYRDGDFHTIDGDASPEDVETAVMSALGLEVAA